MSNGGGKEVVEGAVGASARLLLSRDSCLA